jgi:DNA-binding transcriptional regulator/RsmH inhibitor MraZ
MSPKHRGKRSRNDMSIYIGMHTIRLQEGNRLRLPAELCRSLRDDLLDEDKGLFFVRRENIITIEPAIPTVDLETSEVSLDEQDSFPLPDTVMRWLGANHGDHIVLVGTIDTIEVFTARQWRNIAATTANTDNLPSE